MLLTACGNPLLVDLAPSAPAEWSSSLDVAVAYWRGCGYDVERGPSGVEVELGNTGVPLDAAIWSGGRIVLRDDATSGLDNPYPTWTTTLDGCAWSTLVSEGFKHEMGHALGFGHEPEENAVMYLLLPFCSVRTFDERCPGV